MGNTPFRSWRLSRQRLFQSCKRAFFYQYYWKGEPNQDLLWELRRVTTVPMLIGDIVHESISVALRQWVRTRVQAKNLFDGASKQYDDRLKASLHRATVMRRGCRPPGKGSILVHHLLTGEHSAIEEAGRETLGDHLAAFESREAWQFMRNKKTYTQLWEPITTRSDDMPHFISTAELGFSRAIGLRLYTPYDLALENRGQFILVDW